MFRRILRSLIALATIIVVYQAYVLLAVPWLEPPLAEWRGRPSTPDDHALGANAPSKYQKLLASYFPADHWSQKQPPKVLGKGPTLLVVDDYKREDDGWIKIDKFALLLFPTPLVEGAPPPSDAIVLEAPEGAKLQFDDNFRPERMQVGQIKQGEFPGPITIRSQMHDPGPEDDLYIETSKLAMNSKLMYTPNPIRFRLGANVGSGRDLEIRFQNDEPAGARKMGVSSLEIRRDVQLRIDLKTDSFLPSSKSGPPAERGNAAAEHANENRPPVDVTCTGPFQFDFLRHVASFDQNVQVRQLDPNGPGDRIDAQQLDIHFAPKATATGSGAAAAAGNDAGGSQQMELGRLEPALVVAQGQPVVVTSPRMHAEARAQHVQLDLRQRRVALDGGRDTTLTFGLNVLKAPAIEYWHPAADAGTRVGRFRASGPGSLYYVLDPTKPDEVFQAAWQKSVELGRSNGQPALALAGRPQLGVAGMGNLAADQLTIWFRELVGAPQSVGGLALPGESAGGEKSQLIPDRMAATGQVEVASAGLTARTEQLAATFEAEVAPVNAGGTDAKDSNAGPILSSGTAAQPSTLANQLQPTKGKEPPTTSYHVEADRLQLGVRLHGRVAAPTTVQCDGNVVLREISLVPSTQQPFEVRGAQLTAVGLDGDAARIKVVGSGPTGAAQYVSTPADAAEIAKSQLTQLSGRGLTLLTAAIEIDQRENRLWSDGPGMATILIAHDLDGRATATPRPFEIQWQNGMDFDGRRATFRGSIQGRGTDDRLRCDQLVAKLATPIKFASPQARIDKNATEVTEIEFQGQVMIDHFARDDEGPVSHDRLELTRFAINQQTGAISGAGPGIIRSTRFGDQTGGFGALTAVGQPAADVAQPRGTKSKLSFTRIDFDDRLAGNLNLRVVSFSRRVRAVNGPVDSWEQELSGDQPELLPASSMVITCDELSANEDPVAARAAANAPDKQANKMGPVQLVALGNVRFDGRSANGGRFVAVGMKASYDQVKKLITLEGDGRTPASVITQKSPGEPMNPPLRGSPIRYDLERHLPSVENFESVEFTFPDAPQPAPARSPPKPLGANQQATRPRR